MLTRLWLVAVASIPLGFGTQAGASPITFAYAGTLDQPINGSKDFSGTFTIDGDPKAPNYQEFLVKEGGNDVTVTLKLGGQVINFANPPDPFNRNDGPNAAFSVGVSPSWHDSSSGPLQFETAIFGNSSSSSLYANIGLMFFGPAIDNLSNLRDLTFPLTRVADVEYGLGSSGVVTEGTINSVELVTTPEPGTLAVFAVLGAAAVAFRRRLRS